MNLRACYLKIKPMAGTIKYFHDLTLLLKIKLLVYLRIFKLYYLCKLVKAKQIKKYWKLNSHCSKRGKTLPLFL